MSPSSNIWIQENVLDPLDSVHHADAVVLVEDDVMMVLMVQWCGRGWRGWGGRHVM